MTGRTLIGQTQTEINGRWAVNVSEVEIEASIYVIHELDFKNEWGYLQSSYEYLAVPSDVHDDLKAQFENNGFVCDSATTRCASSTSCSAVAGNLPEVLFRIKDGDGDSDYFELEITPEVYLFQDDN